MKKTRRRRFPFRPGTWVRLFYFDAKHLCDNTLKEAEASGEGGLWVRELRAVYMGCSKTAFFFAADYVHGAESQDLEAVPRGWVNLNLVEKLPKSDYSKLFAGGSHER